MAPSLHINNLSKLYRGEHNVLVGLHPLEATLPLQKLICVVGKSGSGATLYGICISRTTIVAMAYGAREYGFLKIWWNYG